MKKSLVLISLLFVSMQSTGVGNSEINNVEQVNKFSRESRILLERVKPNSFREWSYKYDVLQAQYDKLEMDFQNRPSKGSSKKSSNFLTDDEYQELIHKVKGNRAVTRIYPPENQWVNVRFYNPLNVKIKQIELIITEDITEYKTASNEKLSENSLFRDIYWNISDRDKKKPVEQVYLGAKNKFLSDLDKKHPEITIRVDVNANPYSMVNVNFEIPSNFDIERWNISKLIGE